MEDARMNQAPTEIDPRQSMFAETLGRTPGRARLAGRRVIVVGAGQRPSPPGETVPVGNGRAIALLAAREGAAVACVDAVATAAEATVSLIAAEGGRAFAELADVRDAAAIAPLAARCAARLGGLDGLVLNVGISRGLPLDRITADTWDDEFAVNLRSHMLFAQAALQSMADGGSIVLMSSLAALRNQSRNPTYEASKAAQVSLARSIAVAGEAKAIRCNAVLPGVDGHADGSRRDATPPQPRGGGAVRPPGHRLGSGPRLHLLAVARVELRQRPCPGGRRRPGRRRVAQQAHPRCGLAASCYALPERVRLPLTDGAPSARGAAHELRTISSGTTFTLRPGPRSPCSTRSSSSVTTRSATCCTSMRSVVMGGV
jgi:NAD(P)-dependent dehydrogenase (short-subunit alcohol dehydrogenase family)